MEGTGEGKGRNRRSSRVCTEACWKRRGNRGRGGKQTSRVCTKVCLRRWGKEEGEKKTREGFAPRRWRRRGKGADAGAKKVAG